jgi:cell division protein FtsQ
VRAGGSAGDYGPNRGKSGNDRMKRIFTTVILFLLAVLVLEIVFHLFIAPELVIKTINIKARDDFPLSNAEILEAAEVRERPYFFSVSSGDIERRLERIPMVEDAAVSTSFPDTMTIDLRGRAPIGVIPVTSDGGMQQALVDDQGVIFAAGGEQVHDLPVISGIEVPQMSSGMRLPEQVKGFLRDMETLRSNAPSLYRLISEVKFVKKNESSFEVLLYPAHYRVRVRLGPTLDTHTLKYIMLVLDVISGRGMEDDIVEVDFRTEHVVYRVGEE